MTEEELEWQTRRDRINKKLKALNPSWSIIKYHDKLDTSTLQCHAVEEYQTESGPADYALFVKGQLLGIIEAKKLTVGAENVLEQAKFQESIFQTTLYLTIKATTALLKMMSYKIDKRMSEMVNPNLLANDSIHHTIFKQIGTSIPDFFVNEVKVPIEDE